MFGQCNKPSRTSLKPDSSPFYGLDRSSKGSNRNYTQGNQLQKSRTSNDSDGLKGVQLTQSKKDMLEKFRSQVTRFDQDFQNHKIQETEQQQESSRIQPSSRKLNQQDKSTQQQFGQQFFINKQIRQSHDKQANGSEKQPRQSLCLSISDNSGELDHQNNLRKTFVKGNEKPYFSQVKKSNSPLKNNISYPSRVSEGQITFQFKQGFSKTRFCNLKKILQELGFLGTDSQQNQISETAVQRVLSNRYEQIRSNGKWEQILRIISQPQSEQQQCYPVYKKAQRGIMKKTSFTQKKVSIVVPQSLQSFIALKQQWKKQIQQSLQVLTSNIIVTKYCFNKDKIQNVQITFSSDFRFFMIRKLDSSITSSLSSLCFLQALNKNKKPGDIFDLQNLVSVCSGLKSKNFQKYIRKHNKIAQQQSFSLIFKNRTIDLVCQSEDQRKAIVKAIKTMKQFGFNK